MFNILPLIKKHIERMTQYDEKKNISTSRNTKEIDDLVELVNEILKKNNAVGTIDKSHICFYPDFVGNIFSPIDDKSLSKIIFDTCFPEPKLKSYFHYTTVDALANILKTNKIRLSNLRKRFLDNEYSEFYSDHKMEGYKKGGTIFGIDYSEKKIMSDIFFISLSGSSFDSEGENKWHEFADKGKGVRIEFEITPYNNDFREVYYSSPQNKKYIPLLKDLFEEIKNKYSIPFNFTYASKIGAFYIKGAFKNENEYRFLIKITSDDYANNVQHIKPVITDVNEQIGYIEISLLANKLGDFKILSIQPGYNCIDSDIQKITHLASSVKPSIKIHQKALEDYGI